MSHITKVRTQLKDSTVLKTVLKQDGYNVIEGRELYKKSQEAFRSAEFTASKKGEFLGFTMDKEKGFYNIIADWDIIRRKQQDVINGITKAYSREKITRMARSRGYSIVTNKIGNKGQIEMVLRKVA